MDFKTLLEKVIEKMKASGYEEVAKSAIHVANEKELRSHLRQYIFRDDSKTAAFVNSVRDAGKKFAVPKESLTEREMVDLISSLLEATFNKKDSKFRIVEKWISLDGDLRFHLADAQGYESDYAVMAVRT
jgi:hypothetical protein